MATRRKTVAVMFGGRSPEHDVSIVTGIQVANAIDPDMFDVFPVYISRSGSWYTGDALLDKATYVPGPSELKKLVPVTLRVDPGHQPCFDTRPSSLLARTTTRLFDVAVLAFHGLFGEDGGIQGLLDVAGVPYTGMRALASAVLMDKIATKRVLADTGIPLLPCSEVRRPARGFYIPKDELRTMFPDTVFPCCVKPCHLGSSIGVARVENWDEVANVLPPIFQLDRSAMIEPFVENLVEYNVALCRFGNEVRTSAIERPKTTEVLLDFKTKYQSGTKGEGTKAPGSTSEGMLSLTRDINPSLSPEFENKIRDYAVKAFMRVEGSGAPRIDFLCNSKTEEIWFNEANPCPGSFGFFLWEAATPSVLFAQLTRHLIEEAERLAETITLPDDPTPEAARLFPRR